MIDKLYTIFIDCFVVITFVIFGGWKVQTEGGFLVIFTIEKKDLAAAAAAIVITIVIAIIIAIVIAIAITAIFIIVVGAFGKVTVRREGTTQSCHLYLSFRLFAPTRHCIIDRG